MKSQKALHDRPTPTISTKPIRETVDHIIALTLGPTISAP